MPRLSAIVPIVCSLVSLVFGIVLLAAGTSTGTAGAQYWLSVNTSHAGQSIIQFENLNQSASGNHPLGSIGELLDGVIPGFTDNLNRSASEGLQEIESDFMGNLTKEVGLKDTYRLYLTQICEGDYDDAQDPDSKVTITKCVSYSDRGAGLRNIRGTMASSFVIGTTRVTVPLVDALGASVDSMVSLAEGGAKALLAFLVTGTVCSGLVLAGSVAGLLLSFRRVLTDVTMVVAAVGEAALVVLAVLTTSIAYGGAGAVREYSAAVQLQAQPGHTFTALAWIAAVAAIVSGVFWFAVWFVEIRTTAFARRLRSEDQVGNWNGTFHELVDDLRVSPEKKFG